MNTKTLLRVIATVAAVWLSGVALLAQDRDFGGPPGGPGGNFDPAQFRQRMMEQVRKNLSVTNDEEWGVIQPLVQKVMDARRENFMGGGMGMMMGPGGPPPGAGPGWASSPWGTRFWPSTERRTAGVAKSNQRRRRRSTNKRCPGKISRRAKETNRTKLSPPRPT